MRGQPITSYEREKIELFMRGRWSLRKIAKHLCRDHSVIVREIQRNKERHGIYCASSANENALKRLHKEHRHKLNEDDVLRNYVPPKNERGMESTENCWETQKPSGFTSVWVVRLPRDDIPIHL